MSEASDTEAKRRSRLRWVTLGEAIAIAALIISGIGLWREFNKPDDKPVVVEKTATIPLTLRGRAQDEGRSLEISPVENSHALQSLTLVAGKSTIELGSDGELAAKSIENAIGKPEGDSKGTQRLRVRAEARYVEAGRDKSATGSYVLTYRWEEGGLLGGRSLRLIGMSRG